MDKPEPDLKNHRRNKPEEQQKKWIATELMVMVYNLSITYWKNQNKLKVSKHGGDQRIGQTRPVESLSK